MNQPLCTSLVPLVLASASPRRQQFLQDLGLQYTVLPAQIDETALPAESAESFVARMALTKAESVAITPHAASWIIGADTIVTVDGKILGKPADTRDALRILQLLNGREHRVLTGLCLLHLPSGTCECRTNESRVIMDKVPTPLLQAYIATGEPMDKAGAYGMQGIGSFLVREIHGSCANVIGLPVAELVQMLLRYKLIAPFAIPK